MKPKLCIVGQAPLVDIGRKAASEFSDEADFIFITSSLEESLTALHQVEGVADIVLAGRSTTRLNSKHLKIPMISFHPTLPDLIQAVLKAQTFDTRIALALSLDDRDFDFPILSRAMNVSLSPFYYGTHEETKEACKLAKKKGYKVIIGGSFTVETAEELGLKGIWLYKGMDMIRTAINKAIEMCRFQHEEIRRSSQLAAVVNHFTDGLLLTDENGQIILDNPLAQMRLGVKQLQGMRLPDVFGSRLADRVLNQGDKILNVVEKGNLVVNYIPIRSAEGIHGLVCTFNKVDEIQNAEFAVRKKLHDRGFSAKYNLDDIIGESEAIRSCKEQARLFAGAKSPILITGESGTGKELFAHGIHRLSDQYEGPFVAINCATLPSELLESELFGYEKGAFTGAGATGKKGLIELAHRGTLFLDEITSLSYPLQAKLLRLLSEHEFLKLGSDRIIPVDIRILAATNVDIESHVAERLFREDLYYRISAFQLHIPPLRERPEDLLPLFLYFVNKLRREIAAKVIEKRQLIQKILIKQPFKGNVRELENIVRRFCLLYQPDKYGEDVDALLHVCLERKTGARKRKETSTHLSTALEITEKDVLLDMVKRHKNKSDISRILNVYRSTLWRKLKKYGIHQ